MYKGAVLVFGENKENRLKSINNFITEIDSKILKKDHPDFLKIDEGDKNSIGIESVRTIINFLEVKPFTSKSKVVVIENAQLLTIQAQNAMLKLLEEPPIYASVFLESDMEDSLIPTIISRCKKKKLTGTVSNNSISEFPLDNLISSDLPKRLEFAEKQSKLEKDEIHNFLKSLLIQERNNFHLQIKTNNETPYTTERIKLITKVMDDLKNTNINTRLALEYLFINL